MNQTELLGEPMTVLLVEDNPAHAEMVFRSFEENRIANIIHHVLDGEAALQYLFREGLYVDPEKSPRPHVILLDLRLPKIDGLEVARVVKSTPDLQSIPIVVLTTSKMEADIDKAYANHINSYLVKPVDFVKFTALMRDLGFYWLGWNQLPWKKP